jgi:hypothetical protein
MSKRVYGQVLQSMYAAGILTARTVMCEYVFCGAVLSALCAFCGCRRCCVVVSVSHIDDLQLCIALVKHLSTVHEVR